MIIDDDNQCHEWMMMIIHRQYSHPFILHLHFQRGVSLKKISVEGVAAELMGFGHTFVDSGTWACPDG